MRMDIRKKDAFLITIGIITGVVTGLFLNIFLQTGEAMFLGLGLMVSVTILFLALISKKRKLPENLIPLSPSIAYQVLQISIERRRRTR